MERQAGSTCGLLAPGRRFDWSPLTHPAWWAALAVLLINDNLLKGRGIVPSWLTGKLSDFAFLLVAPVLLTALLPLALRGRRLMAFAAVTAVFIAADLSPRASDAIVAVAAHLHLRWRLWPDWTDLMALTVLPLTWRLAHPRPIAARPARIVARTLERAGLVTGALACLATSAPLRYDHNPFFTNRTRQAEIVTLTWLLRKVACDADLAALASTANPGDFDDAHRLLLLSGQVAALDVPPSDDGQAAGRCSNAAGVNHDSRSDECAAILVAVERGPAAIVVAPRQWSEDETDGFLSCDSPPAPVFRCSGSMDLNATAGADELSLTLVDGKLVLSAGTKLRMIEVVAAEIAARPSAPDGCRARRDAIVSRLRSAADCTFDSDCQGLPAQILVPGAPVCAAFVNGSLSVSELATMRDEWSANCLSYSAQYCSSAGAPAVCRAGKCAEACVGVQLPTCPPPCSQSQMVPGQVCRHLSLTCASESGDVCSCEVGRALSCHRSFAPGCLYSCWPPGGQTPSPDASSPAPIPEHEAGALDTSRDDGALDADAHDR